MERAWWFVTHNGESQGPVSGDGLAKLALQGVVSASTLVWCEGDAWLPLRDVPELVAAVHEAELREPGGVLL